MLLILLLLGCGFPTTQETTDETIRDLSYGYDPRTDLCFARSVRYGMGLTWVPCRPAITAQACE